MSNFHLYREDSIKGELRSRNRLYCLSSILKSLKNNSFKKPLLCIKIFPVLYYMNLSNILHLNSKINTESEYVIKFVKYLPEVVNHTYKSIKNNKQWQSTREIFANVAENLLVSDGIDRNLEQVDSDIFCTFYRK